MPTKIKPTPTADKLLSIIANRFNLRKDALDPETTWEMMNINSEQKDELLCEIADKFRLTINKPARDKILTIWNALQYIESHDGWNNKPAAYNLD
ncbi:MAG: hypothetical protein AABY22_22690 [Nanoarchaeota archaeon]